MKKILLMATAILLLALWCGAALADNGGFVASENTVRDNATGLSWGVPTWLKPTDQHTLTWDEAQKRIAGLNLTGFGGFKDWRMASRSEMEALYADIDKVTVDNNRRREITIHDKLEAVGLSSIKQSYYWSSNDFDAKGIAAWRVSFKDGSAKTSLKIYPNYVIPVRGGK